MHTFRLLHMAEEIAKNEKVKVRVSPAGRDYLLRIKNADFQYDELVREAEIIKEELVGFYKESSLPSKPDKEQVNKLLIYLRAKFYKNN